MTPAAELPITVVESVDLSGSWRAALHELFDDSYRDADHDYLDRSLAQLRFVAVAVADPRERERGIPQIVGFALGESRTVDLPGLPAQPLALAGLCCVSSAFRREGLFRTLELRAIGAGAEQPPGGRVLAAGRMAHPASLRLIGANPNALPRPGIGPNAFQQRVARAVAGHYGVEGFDPLTFVCRGHGRPIGYPRMAVEATAEEWELFRDVDRDRGDSLLALCWVPDAPPGW